MAVEIRFGKRTRPPEPARQAPAERKPERRAERRLERLAGLDLLRLVAALAVVLFHYGYAGAARGATAVVFPEIAGIAKYGFIGVELFFVISGFVIAASARGRDVAGFAVSRVLRLYPAHVVCMTLTALAVALWSTGQYAVTPVQWLANLTMLAPLLRQPFMDGAYWSIVLEIVFYGWVGVLIALGLMERRLLTVLAFWLGLSLMNEAVWQLKPLRLLLLTEFAPFFASGMLIQMLWRGERRSLVIALLALAIGLGGLHAYENQAVIARIYGDHVELAVLWSLHGGIYALLAGARWLSARLPATPLVLTLGALTYPLYLVHQHAGHIALDRLEPLIGRWPALAVVIALMLAISWLVARFAEPAGRKMLSDALAAASGARRAAAGA